MSSYPSDPERTVIRAAEKLMIKTMARYDPSHDAFHVERVRKTAMSIAKAVPGPVDLLTIELAALLHDVLDKKYVSAEQASDPYRFFLPYFTQWKDESGVDLVADGRGQLIARIVDNVSWSTEKKLRTAGRWGEWHNSCVELHCVQDADRLDAIGAFGVLRCAAYSASVNRPLHTPPGDAANNESSIQHFYDKLLHIKEHLKTEPGKRMGERRHQTLVDFLASVDEEFGANV